MNRQIDYTDEPLLIGERVEDFLPPPGELVKREKTVKVTLELTQETADFFVCQSKQDNIPYEYLLQGIIDTYAKQHLRYLSQRVT